MHKKLLTCAMILAALPVLTSAKVKLPRLVSDGMVLQRDIPANIWGTAKPGEKINLKFNGKSYRTVAGKDGKWSVTLDATPAGGPYTISVNGLTIQDVLFGEVWLCSGQSNMESAMNRYGTEMDAEADTELPLVRHFTAPQIWNIDGPQTDFPEGEWKKMTGKNIADAGATPYFFGKYLFEHFGVPVGILNMSVGGSPIEAWLSPDAAHNFEDMEKQLEQYHDRHLQDSLRTVQRERMSRMSADLSEPVPSFLAESLENTASWNDIYMPGSFADKGIEFNRGVIWLSKEIKLPESDSGKEAVLELGILDDTDSTYVNGKFIGTVFSNMIKRYYHVPAGILRSGKNTISIRLSTSADGGFIVDRDYALSTDDTKVSLSGGWKYKIAQDEPKMKGNSGPAWMAMFMPGMPGKMSPTGLYNAMIAPALPYKFKGVAWYQGESNSRAGGKYELYLKALINDWRHQFDNKSLPWITVQLPEYGQSALYRENSGWADIRDAQRRSLELPATGLATTLGFGEWNIIHPDHKSAVAMRIMLQAQKVAYGEELVAGCPLPSSATESNGAIIITFTETGDGIDANVNNRAFYVAGTDGKFHPATASVISADKVRVFSPEVTSPVKVRYAWHDNPAFANLRNVNGFTTASFEVTIDE